MREFLTAAKSSGILFLLDINDAQRQSPSSDLLLHHSRVVDSSEERIAFGTKATVIAVETPPSDIEGQFAIFARTGGIASADRFVSPHYLKTPCCSLPSVPWMQTSTMAWNSSKFNFDRLIFVVSVSNGKDWAHNSYFVIRELLE
jgi:hypothetical protein